MAKFTLRYEKVEKVVEVDEERLILDLSREEAQTLYDILNHVGGDPRTSRRKHANAVHSALKSECGERKASDLSCDQNGVYFQPIEPFW